MRRLAMLVVLGVLAGAAPAAAADPVLIGEGREAAVAIDAAGTAFIAWIGDEPNITSLHFCRLPRGAPRCAASVTIASPGTSLTRPFVTVSGATVQVLSYRYGLSGPRFDAVYLFISVDGGATFDAGRQVGTIPFRDAALGPGGGISIVPDAYQNGTVYERVPIDGSAPATGGAQLSIDHPYNGTVGLADANTPLVVFSDGSGNGQYRRYSGTGDPNLEANWTPARDIGHDDRSWLASGPSGLFLSTQTTASPGTLGVRRFGGDAVGFGAPVEVPDSTGELASSHLVEDPAGRLHLLWPRIGAAAPTLEYATSDDGRTWQRAAFTIDPLPQSVHAAVGADHLGVAVWNTPGRTPSVYALAIGPAAAPQPVLGRSVAVAPVRGTVRIKVSKGRRFVPLRVARTVPVGSQVDVRRGTVRLVSATNASGATQSGEFTAGIFQALQGRKASGLTDLRLKGGSSSRCGKVRAAAARRRLSRRVLRKLRANARGRFRTTGRYASATVRGTAWDITDRCDGTLVRVRRGVVVVRDVHRRRSITVRAGKSYLARARR